MTQSEREQLSNWQWLTSDSGRSLIEQMPTNSGDPLRVQKWLRKQGVSAERAALIMQQFTLRQKARDKFGKGVNDGPSIIDQMFFQSQLLQQASGLSLAQWKARRFRNAKSIVDLCCGLGGDLLALADCNEHVNATGVDRSEVACHLARANCDAFGVGASIVCETAEQIDLDSETWFHIDPDRRAAGTRTTTIDHFSPSLDTLDGLIASQQNGAIKLAPATEVPEHWHDRCERQWIGDANECKQLVAWFGATSTSLGCRSAAAIGQDGESVFEWTESKPTTCKFAKVWSEYLYEPHPTLIAGRMVDSLAAEFGLAKATSDVAYLTGGRVNFAGMTTFEVVEAVRMDEQAVVEALLRLECGRLEVKKRGLDHQLVDQFAIKVKARLKKLQKSDSDSKIQSASQPLVLILTRLGNGYSAVIAKRR